MGSTIFLTDISHLFVHIVHVYKYHLYCTYKNNKHMFMTTELYYLLLLYKYLLQVCVFVFNEIIPITHYVKISF